MSPILLMMFGGINLIYAQKMILLTNSTDHPEQFNTTLLTEMDNSTSCKSCGIHLVQWKFHEISTPVIVGVFMLSVSVLKLSKYSLLIYISLGDDH